MKKISMLAMVMTMIACGQAPTASDIASGNGAGTVGASPTATQRGNVVSEEGSSATPATDKPATAPVETSVATTAGTPAVQLPESVLTPMQACKDVVDSKAEALLHASDNFPGRTPGEVAFDKMSDSQKSNQYRQKGYQDCQDIADGKPVAAVQGPLLNGKFPDGSPSGSPSNCGIGDDCSVANCPYGSQGPGSVPGANNVYYCYSWGGHTFHEPVIKDTIDMRQIGNSAWDNYWVLMDTPVVLGAVFTGKMACGQRFSGEVECIIDEKGDHFPGLPGEHWVVSSYYHMESSVGWTLEN